ncbi:unnamed protein product [Caenorhabditis bovis]|uniref:Major facilitator superfamily (MFS) profile domain-containing protein n=1 Tax=Caenorhabditis bovis TaxID=2654633 RepID=A0A8S1E9X1_9PELO|nr:unnamed protein product [Caenorhabditis bovis]
MAEAEQPLAPARSEKITREQEQDLNENQLRDLGVAIPPDGGYGWVIVAASFLLNAIFDGVIYTQGKVFAPAWKESFNVSDSVSSGVFSLLIGFYYVSGPIASAFCNVFGCRKVAIFGALLACVGFIFSMAAPNVFVLYLTFSVISGTGFGFMYLPAIVVISQYFAKKRSSATGIAVCGSGIGTTILAIVNDPVFGFVSNDWRMFCLFPAILSFSGIFVALFLSPVEVKQHQETPQITIDQEPVVVEEQDLAASQNDLMRDISENVEQINRPLSHLDVFYPASTTTIEARSRANSIDGRNNLDKPDINETTLLVHFETHKDINNISKKKKPVHIQVFESIKELGDKDLLGSITFLLLAFSGTLTLICFYVPFMFIGLILDQIPGITTEAKAFIISFIGVCNIAGRIGCGYIADHPRVSALVVNNVALVVAGLATMAVPHFTAYWHFVVYCIPFAFGIAVFAALRSVICVELLGVENLNKGFGFMMFFMGVGAVVGSPMAAYIRELTGSYNISFYVMGSIMAISGLICIPLARIRQWELRRARLAETRGTEMLQINA